MHGSSRWRSCFVKAATLLKQHLSSVALLELGLETLAHFELSVRLVLSLQVMHAQN